MKLVLCIDTHMDILSVLIRIANKFIYFFFYFYTQYNVEETTMIFVCSMVLHLLIEAPFNNIRKLIFDKKMVTVKKLD